MSNTEDKREWTLDRLYICGRLGRLAVRGSESLAKGEQVIVVPKSTRETVEAERDEAHRVNLHNLARAKQAEQNVIQLEERERRENARAEQAEQRLASVEEERDEWRAGHAAWGELESVKRKLASVTEALREGLEGGTGEVTNQRMGLAFRLGATEGQNRKRLSRYERRRHSVGPCHPMSNTEDKRDEPMRVCYADPPYPGQSAKHYADHPDYAGEVDHAELLEQLREYDGWILHTNEPGLRIVLPLCPPEARVMAWVKPFAAFKRNVSVAYAWEPVIVKACRKPRIAGHIVSRDFISHPITMRKGLAGVKPDAVIWWALTVAGVEPGDDVDDLFPGSGAVMGAWESMQAQTRLDG